MTAFNSMPVLGPGQAPAPDSLGHVLAIDTFDNDLAFDEPFLDPVGSGLSGLQFAPHYDFDPFTTFEDPFSYPATRGPFDAASSVSLNAAAQAQAQAAQAQASSSSTSAHAPSISAAASIGPGGPFDVDGAEDRASPQELDNKLLGFGDPIIKASLPDEATGGAPADIAMAAELYGMFFVAEDVFGGDQGAGTPARPLELTCYRRNLWQCSGHIVLPRHVGTHALDDAGRPVPLVELAASITAIESIEGKPTEIISIPWKSANPAPTAAAAANGAGASAAPALPPHHPTTTDEAAKVAGAPPIVPLDLSAALEVEGTAGQRVSVGVSWKRLQFKHATANNGRRKGLQQHYVVQINLLGKVKGGSASTANNSSSTTSSSSSSSSSSTSQGAQDSAAAGEYIKIAEIQSGPVIVRGRSPRNFDSRRDVPLTGDRKPERRSFAASDAATPVAGKALAGADRGELAQNLQRYHSLGNVQQSTDWATAQPFGNPGPQHAAKKLALSPQVSRPPVPSWSSDHSISPSSMAKQGLVSPNHQQQSHQQQQQHQRPGGPTLPISLSLSEDERSPNHRAGSDPLQSPAFSKTGSAAAAAQSQAQNPLGSPFDNEDMLYEYFPLSLDDWVPPVDAIYRPHVVHHTVVPPEVKAQQVRSKTKRYFVGE